jgi:hypothetical protein
LAPKQHVNDDGARKENAAIPAPSFFLGHQATVPHRLTAFLTLSTGTNSDE